MTVEQWGELWKLLGYATEEYDPASQQFAAMCEARRISEGVLRHDFGLSNEDLEKVELAQVGNTCHAQKDGDCDWEDCPQKRDGEPAKSGRHCPLDV